MRRTASRAASSIVSGPSGTACFTSTSAKTRTPAVNARRRRITSCARPWISPWSVTIAPVSTFTRTNAAPAATATATAAAPSFRSTFTPTGRETERVTSRTATAIPATVSAGACSG